MRKNELLKIKDKKYDRKVISVHLSGRNIWCSVINKVIFNILKGCNKCNISVNNVRKIDWDDDWDDEDNSSVLVEDFSLFALQGCL